MEKPTGIIIFAVIVLILVGSIVFISSNNSTPAEKITNSTKNQTIVETTNTTKASTISEADLATHSSKSDCWVAYKGNVYDVTDWLPKHPGSSAAIEPYCGTANEFEQAFIKKHGTRMASTLVKVGRLMGGFDKVGVTA